MLYRMYTRWCEKRGFKITILDYQEGEEAGIKSVSLLIKGLYAYGYLKGEKGVHRLVRLSPFDSNNRRHTSFASVEVTPDIDIDNNIEIDEKDLKIDVVLKNKLLLLKLEEQEKELNKIKGDQANINFGSQIRSYVMHPYSMVKDHRTNVETSNVTKVLDGDIDAFIDANLAKGI